MAGLRLNSKIIGNFRNVEIFIAILLSIKNDAYTRILDALACSRDEKSSKEISKLQSGQTTL